MTARKDFIIGAKPVKCDVCAYSGESVYLPALYCGSEPGGFRCLISTLFGVQFPNPHPEF